LYLVTDKQSARGKDLLEVVESALQGGVTTVQVRDKDSGAFEIVTFCKAVKLMTDRFDAALIVDDRVDVAIAAGADGVHLGDQDIPPGLARSLMGRGAIIGATAASIEMAMEAEEQGADYIGVGPFKPTSTKPGHADPLGIEGLARIGSSVSIPWVAIGGITARDAEAIIRAGASGIAVASAICGAEDPKTAAEEIKRAIKEGIGVS